MGNKKSSHVTNVIASLLGYAVPLLVNFAAIPYLMASLGADAFGIQVLVNVVIGYLALMDLGIGLPLIKYLAEDRAKGDMTAASDLLSTTLVLYLGLGLLGMFVAFAFSGYLAESFFSIPHHLINEAASVFQLAAAGFLGTLLMGWGRSVAMGLQRYEIAYAISALSSVLGVGAGVYLIHAGFGVVGYVFSKVLFLFIAALVYFIIYRVLMPEYKIRFRFQKASFTRMRSYLAYGIIHRGVSGLAGSIDKTLLGVWVSAASVGLYSIPSMLTSAISYALSFMLSFILPASSALYETGEHGKLKDLFMDSSRFLVAVSCMVIVPLILLGHAFLYLWVGAKVAENVLIALYLLAIAVFFNVTFASLASNILVGIGCIRYFTIYTIIRVCVFSSFCVLLIPALAFKGAALAELFTAVLDMFYLMFFLNKYLKVKVLTLFLQAFLRPVLLGGAVTLLLSPLLNMQLAWGEFVFFLCLIEALFVVSYYKFNVITSDEKIKVMNFIKRR